MNDWTLLQEFLDHRSEAAFEALVRRHLGMVHAAALRQVRDPHLAEDVTQGVFVLLARKAATFNSGIILAGWLHRTAVNLARRASRDDSQRQIHDHEAFSMTPPDSNEEIWMALAPHLDSALSELGGIDRDAVVLRYLQQRSFQEVGTALGLGEDAAKKRVARAIEKLRDRLQRHGVAVSSGLVGAVMSVHAASALPEGLVRSTVAAGTSGGASTSLSVKTLIGGWTRHAAVTRMKWGVAAVTGAAFLALSIWIIRPTRPTVPDSVPAVASAASSSEPVALVFEQGAVDRVAATRSVRLRVVTAANDQPLPGSQVKAVFYGAPTESADFVTDADGWAVIPRPERRFEGMYYCAYSPGRVPLLASWDRIEEPSLPSEYVLRLELGKTVSGQVVNPEGQPVEGARLVLNGEGTKWDSRHEITYRKPTPTIVTDVQGHWILDFLNPAARWIRGRVEHADYASSEISADLSAGTNLVFQIQRGVQLEGTVRDQMDDSPISADIVLEATSGNLEDQSMTSTANGRFTFPQIAPGEYRLKAQTSGFLPTEVPLVIRESSVSKDVQIRRFPVAGNSLLRGRIVSDRGDTIRAARIHFRGGPTPGAELSWDLPVGTDGRWEWQTAPNQVLAPEFFAWGHESRTVDLAPGSDEQTVILHAIPEVLVRGTVTRKSDAQAVPYFKLMQRNNYSPRFLGEGHDGHFAFRMDARELESNNHPFRPQDPVYQARLELVIEAEGFAQRVVSVPPVIDSQCVLSVELDPIEYIAGTVYGPDHQPAVGAWVSYRGPGAKSGIYLMEPEYFGIRDRDYHFPFHTKAATGDDGEFRLPPVDGATRLAVVHASGWANTPLDRDSSEPILLQPWGRVEGIVQVGGSPSVQAKVMLRSATNRPEQIIFTEFRATTDSNGRFVFPKVPGGHASAQLWLESDNVMIPSHSATTEVRPGETSQIVLGGSGIRLTGRILPPSKAPPVDWRHSQLKLLLQDPQPMETGPLPLSGIFGAFCQGDGSFTFEDIPPGDYRLQIELRASFPRLGSRSLLSLETEPEPITIETMPVAIPPDMKSGETVDIGTVEVKGKPE